LKANSTAKKFSSEYFDHSRSISDVQFNKRVENVFISSSFDGLVKLWDLRNEEKPISTMKRAKADPNFKVFSC